VNQNSKVYHDPCMSDFYGGSFFTDLDTYTAKLFYPDQHLIFHKNTPYGKLDVTMKASQLNYLRTAYCFSLQEMKLTMKNLYITLWFSMPIPKRYCRYPWDFGFNYRGSKIQTGTD